MEEVASIWDIALAGNVAGAAGEYQKDGDGDNTMTAALEDKPGWERIQRRLQAEGPFVLPRARQGHHHHSRSVSFGGGARDGHFQEAS